MKPITKSEVVWIARDSHFLGCVAGFLYEPSLDLEGYFHSRDDGLFVPCFLGKLGLRPGRKRKVRMTFTVEDAE